MSILSRHGRNERDVPEISPPAPSLDRPSMPVAVKIMLVLVAVNLVVAAMVLVKLRAPHLG